MTEMTIYKLYKLATSTQYVRWTMRPIVLITYTQYSHLGWLQNGLQPNAMF